MLFSYPSKSTPEIDVSMVHSEDLELRRDILMQASSAIANQVLSWRGRKLVAGRQALCNLAAELGMIDRELCDRKRKAANHA